MNYEQALIETKKHIIEDLFNESFIKEKHLQSIEDFAKKMGVWGSEIMPHIDVAVTNKDYSSIIRFSQLFNRFESEPYLVVSIK